MAFGNYLAFFRPFFRPETENNDFHRYSFWKRLSGCRLRLVVKFDPSTRKAPLVRPKKRCGRRRRVVAGVKPDKNNIVYVSTGRISYPGRSQRWAASAEDRAATRPQEPLRGSRAASRLKTPLRGAKRPLRGLAVLRTGPSGPRIASRCLGLASLAKNGRFAA